MKDTIFLLALLLMVLLACCVLSNNAGSDKNALGKSLLKDAGGLEFGGGLCEETVAVAKNSGYDYIKIVNGCCNREESAYKDLFWLTQNAGFDAASSEGNAAVLGCLLRSEGDRIFASVLATTDRPTILSVKEQLLYDYGMGDYLQNEEKGWEIFKDLFPRTAKVLE